MKQFSPKLVMIDVDGTLVDSVPDLAFCVNELMRTMKRNTWSEEQVLKWVGNGVAKLVERALVGKLEGKANLVDFARAYPIFIDLYAHNVSRRSYLYKGVRKGLSYLKSKNIIIGCVTNKSEQFTLPLLKDLAIFDEFAIVISGDTLAKRKPDPLPLLHAAKHFNIDPKDCLMLGDSVSDIQASRAAKFKIICMSYGYNHGIDIAQHCPDAVIDSMTQLIDYIV